MSKGGSSTISQLAHHPIKQSICTSEKMPGCNFLLIGSVGSLSVAATSAIIRRFRLSTKKQPKIQDTPTTPLKTSVNDTPVPTAKTTTKLPSAVSTTISKIPIKTFITMPLSRPKPTTTPVKHVATPVKETSTAGIKITKETTTTATKTAKAITTMTKTFTPILPPKRSNTVPEVRTITPTTITVQTTSSCVAKTTPKPQTKSVPEPKQYSATSPSSDTDTSSTTPEEFLTNMPPTIPEGALPPPAVLTPATVPMRHADLLPSAICTQPPPAPTIIEPILQPESPALRANPVPSTPCQSPVHSHPLPGCKSPGMSSNAGQVQLRLPLNPDRIHARNVNTSPHAKLGRTLSMNKMGGSLLGGAGSRRSFRGGKAISLRSSMGQRGLREGREDKYMEKIHQKRKEKMKRKENKENEGGAKTEMSKVTTAKKEKGGGLRRRASQMQLGKKMRLSGRIKSRPMRALWSKN